MSWYSIFCLSNWQMSLKIAKSSVGKSTLSATLEKVLIYITFLGVNLMIYIEILKVVYNFSGSSKTWL